MFGSGADLELVACGEEGGTGLAELADLEGGDADLEAELDGDRVAVAEAGDRGLGGLAGEDQGARPVAEVALEAGEDVAADEGLGVIGAEEPLVAREGLGGEVAGAHELALGVEDEGEAVDEVEGEAVVGADEGEGGGVGGLEGGAGVGETAEAEEGVAVEAAGEEGEALVGPAEGVDPRDEVLGGREGARELVVGEEGDRAADLEAEGLGVVAAELGAPAVDEGVVELEGAAALADVAEGAGEGALRGGGERVVLAVEVDRVGERALLEGERLAVVAALVVGRGEHERGDQGVGVVRGEAARELDGPLLDAEAGVVAADVEVVPADAEGEGDVLLAAGEAEEQGLGVGGPGAELGPALRALEGVRGEELGEDVAGAGGLVAVGELAQEVGEDAVHGPKDLS